ncbi:MAG: NAD(P)-dependent oxidoreductase [bacterium]|nr:NAD(P)-dependent oxidoreductase [bacterium]
MTGISLNKIITTGADGMAGSYVDFGIKTGRRQLDVTNLEQVVKFVKNYSPKAIIHLAAETNVDLCEQKPERAYLINSIGAYNVAMASKMVGSKLIYVSTNAVFNGDKKSAYIETDQPDPQSIYGRSKYIGELVISSLLKDYIIIRTCWLFGGGLARDHKFVTKIIQQLKNLEIKAINDQYGSPTFCKDLVTVIKRLIEDDERGLFHVVNGGSCSRYDIAREIVAHFKSSAKIIPVSSSFFGTNKLVIANGSLTSSKVIGMRTWQEALREYLETEWTKQ